MLDPNTYAKDDEHSNQVALFMWASMPDTLALYPELVNLFAIPNGGTRDKVSAGKMKAEGVKSGVPDIFLAVARHNCHGLFIELKRDKSINKERGVISDNQTKWIDRLMVNGYGVCVCYSYQEAKQVLIRYLTK